MLGSLRVLQIADYVKATPDYVSSNSTARAEPGVKWSEFDRVIQAFGLATTGGTGPDNGIAGLTLRGGIGLESAHILTSLPEGAVP